MTKLSNITLDMENVVDFIKENQLIMDTIAIHENPCRTKKAQHGLSHWSCKIECGDNPFAIIYFSKGTGIRQWKQPQQAGNSIPLHVPYEKTGAPYDGPMPPFQNPNEQHVFDSCSQVEPPFLAEVLEILARDIAKIEQQNFELWAKNQKLPPSHAKFSFDVIRQQRQELLKLLGDGKLHKLLYELDRIDLNEIEKIRRNLA